MDEQYLESDAINGTPLRLTKASELFDSIDDTLIENDEEADDDEGVDLDDDDDVFVPVDDLFNRELLLPVPINLTETNADFNSMDFDIRGLLLPVPANLTDPGLAGREDPFPVPINDTETGSDGRFYIE